MKKYTVNEIQEIFYSGSHSFRADKQLVVDTCFLLEEELLFLNQVEIAAKKAYLNYINDIRRSY